MALSNIGQFSLTPVSQNTTGESDMCPSNTAPVTTETLLQHCPLQDAPWSDARSEVTPVKKLHNDLAEKLHGDLAKKLHGDLAEKLHGYLAKKLHGDLAELKRTKALWPLQWTS